MADGSYSPKVYRKQGGDEMVVASGGKINIESGGTLELAGVDLAAELAALNGLDATELGYLNGVTAGTVTASKGLVAGATKNLDVLAVADLKLGAGAGTSVTATAAELNKMAGLGTSKPELEALNGLPFIFTLTPAAGAANVCEVTIQAKDADGVNIAHVVPLLVWLSDAASGFGLTATSASGTVQAKSGSQDLAALTGKKALLVQTSAAGAYVLEITDAAKTAFKVCVSTLRGELPTIETLEAADYGA